MIGVLHILSQVLGALAFALLPPAAVGLITGEIAAAQTFLAVAGLVGFVAGAFFFALQGRGRRLDRAAGFVLVVAVWVIPPLIAAIPLMQPAGGDYMTALFETVSGYTTTGATNLPTLAPLGFTGVFFRAELQWLGGLMTLLTIVTVLAPSGLGGVSNTNLVLIVNPEDRYGRILGAVRQVVFAYSAVTLACLLLLFASGIRPFDAVCLTFSAMSTGGFMPIDGDLSAYRNGFANAVLAVFMLVGATSIIWHRMVLEGRWQLLRHHSESYWVIGIAVAAGLAYAVAFAQSAVETDVRASLGALGDGLLAGASLVSTTGFEPRPGGLAALPAAVVILLAIIGGGAASTAGGIKYYRVGGMIAQALNELRRLVYPHAIRGSRFGSVAYNLELMRGIWSNLAICLVIIVAATMLIALELPSFDGAFTAAVAAFSSIGPLYPASSVSSGWPAYADFGGFTKGVLIATMILGRIEVLALFAAVNFAYWRS